MCVSHLIAIWEKDSISLWILELGVCRSWRSLTCVVCIVPHIHAVITIDGSTIHPSSLVGIRVGGGWRIHQVIRRGLCR